MSPCSTYARIDWAALRRCWQSRRRSISCSSTCHLHPGPLLFISLSLSFEVNIHIYMYTLFYYEYVYMYIQTRARVDWAAFRRWCQRKRPTILSSSTGHPTSSSVSDRPGINLPGFDQSCRVQTYLALSQPRIPCSTYARVDWAALRRCWQIRRRSVSCSSTGHLCPMPHPRQR